MAKATTIDFDLLQNSIDEAETNGPLPNLGELWTRSVAIYNNKVHFKFPKINPSFAQMQAKKNHLVFKTKAGKRGRPAKNPNDPTPVGIAVKSGTNVLIPLTEWEDKECTIGKYKGTVSRRRWVIVGDKYCWGLVGEKPDGTFAEMAGYAYCGNFRQLLPTIAERNICDMSQALDRLVAKFTEITGKEVLLDTRKSWSVIGKAIDTGFEVSYGLYPNVFKRIFRTDPVESKADENNEG